MPIHLIPVIYRVVDHLGSKERARRLRREQAPCLGFPQEPVQVAGSYVCAAAV
jgi:hypothetical protein